MRLLRVVFYGFLAFLLIGYVAGYSKPDPGEFAKLAERAGFPPVTIPKAQRVATCESGLKPQAVGDGHLTTEKWGPSVGPFQVRTQWTDLIGDRSPILNWIPQFNATAAYKISKGGTDWSAWTCGKS